MSYKFPQNVHLVAGGMNAIIYDLRNKYAILHWLDSEARLFLNSLINAKHKGYRAKTKAEKDLLNFLFNNKLIESCNEKAHTKDILEKNGMYNILFAWIEITSVCNYRCKHCYGEFGGSSGNSMSENDFSLVLDHLDKLGVNRVQFIGGEPLSLGFEKIKWFIEKAVYRGFLIEIFTNGYFINDEYVKLFKKNNIRLALSVYGPNRIHDEITNHSGSFESLRKAVALLEEHKIEYRLANTRMIDNENINDTEIAKELNISQRKLKSDILRLAGRGSLQLLSEKLIKKQLIDKDDFKSNRIKSEYVLKNMQAHNCFRSRIYVSYDLTVYPCVMERRFNYGNIKKSDINKLLEGGLNYICFIKDKVKICQNCEYRYACFDCRPNSITAKQYDSKPWYCPYDPLTGTWMAEEKHISQLVNTKGGDYAN